MSTWSNKKPACVMTWVTLAIMDQSKKAFPRSENVKVKNLQFWNPASNPQLRKARARGLAIQMDGLFKELGGAKYEPGVNRQKAVSASLQVLEDGEKTLSDLASVNNAHYRFLGERE